MRQFVSDNIRIEVAVVIGIRTGKDIHLHSSASAVRRSSKICVVRSRTILRFRRNAVAAAAHSRKVRILEVARGFGETDFIQFVVITVGNIKQLRHRTVAKSRKRRRIACRIVSKIERAGCPVRLSRRINAIYAVNIETGLHIIAVGRAVSAVSAVGHPTQIIKRIRCFVADERDI